MSSLGFLLAIFLIFTFMIIELQFLLGVYNNFIKFSKENIGVLDVQQLKFDHYLKDFNKKYSGEEYARRFKNFKESLKEIAKLNALENSAVFGLTKFADMSKEEFADRMLFPPSTTQCQSRYKYCDSKLPTNSLMNRRKYKNNIPPSSFDWRKDGVIKPVLNQKRCRACWAFSIIGVMESMAAIQNKSHESLSIQELIDCSKFNHGCRGGDISIALDYLCGSKLRVDTADKYPLTLVDNGTCKLPGSGVRLLEYSYKCRNNNTTMVEMISSHGPLVAGVDSRNWMYYLGGVIQRACSGSVLNHVVQIVGYNSESETPVPYYIIKNSFGEDFGEDGYVKIAMDGNVCGITDQIAVMTVLEP